ncbi:hypothetical protein NHX12_029605 [Muraenolepis orangiensis]|uniref:Uncharacterized protein n=1 Tax=Muraenolepis orangiensis TaxID=630683 RepID=A0A9Q0IIP7_9TELE|nr:hypothetical protein NHX12_029605 [Muraenolepis orangiensis]
MFASGYAGGPRGAPGRRKSSHCPADNPQIPKPAGPGSVPRSISGGSGGKMLSMSYSESIRSGISRYHSDQGLNLPRPADQAELQRLREQRVAAQIKNMEDFLKMNGLALEECVSYQTGMKYRTLEQCVCNTSPRPDSWPKRKARASLDAPVRNPQSQTPAARHMAWEGLVRLHAYLSSGIGSQVEAEQTNA